MGHVLGVIGWRKGTPLSLPRGRKRGEQRRAKATKSHPQVQIGPDSSGRKRQSTPDRSGLPGSSHPKSAPVWTCLDLSRPICPKTNFLLGEAVPRRPLGLFRLIPGYSRIIFQAPSVRPMSPTITHLSAIVFRRGALAITPSNAKSQFLKLSKTS